MNEVITWAKQWPQAGVQPIKLLEDQGRGQNKERRNWFYEQFGIVFDYLDPERRAGVSRPMLVEGLKSVDAWKKNIKEWRLLDYLGEIMAENEACQLEFERVDKVNSELRKWKKEVESSPLPWALREVWGRYAVQLVVISAIGLFGFGVYRVVMSWVS